MATARTARRPHVSLDAAGQCLAVLDVDALMVGGSDQTDTYTDVVEHFSASTGRWTRRAPLPDRRDLHTTTALDSTTVLVIGGEGGTGVRADGYTYDVTTDVWSPLDAMNRPRLGHAAVVLPDNSVLVVGGADDGSCELLA
ncbi:kelch repeat-containing protein [Actinomycetospora flava]|uniref:Kelch repeat-containing protein n=1 Tax=Actinomycetospora flava TaxID=3129232 RepID=A0ABU8MC22_9PSEU